ncbi:YfbM family protein [Micromonospora sp. NPDC023814]|uniref:YfbM family protein n=1 Tax=Micromonospora sp. NPDC023814 TaxID=3154596 RepID=UPI0033D41B74
MGSVLSFTRVTSEELDRAFADPEWAAEHVVDDEDRPVCCLDKAWAGLQFLLDGAEVGVDLYENGDVIDEECTLFGWDDGRVAEAARALSATPFEALARHFDPKGMSEARVYPGLWDDDDLDRLERHHAELVEFFVATAASGGAAIRDFNF